MARKAGHIRIGISGWTYPPWRGVFYPEGLAHKHELEHVGKTFRSVEINGTFYSLQRSESFDKWAGEVPDDFVFAVKGSRYITHMRRLKEADRALANFFASGVLKLGLKLGPFLWQLPPNMRFEPERIEAFLQALPKDTEAAARLARRHDERMEGRAWTRPGAKRRLRHAMEIRHRSFVDPGFVRLLRAHKVALVCADSVDWPRLMDVTADFVYCRLHGSEELYASGYDAPAIQEWAERVVAWATGGEPTKAERVIERAGPKRKTRDVFVYFDNDAKVRAPFDAQALMTEVAKRLGG